PYVAARDFLPESRAEGQRQPLDVLGAILVTAGLTALVFGVVRTTSVGWGSWQTIVALALAVGLMTWFVFHEGHVGTSPLVRLALFRRRSIWTANLVLVPPTG